MPEIKKNFSENQTVSSYKNRFQREKHFTGQKIAKNKKKMTSRKQNQNLVSFILYSTVGL